MHTFSPSTWEVEGGGSTEARSRTAKATERSCLKKPKAEIEKEKERSVDGSSPSGLNEACPQRPTLSQRSLVLPCFRVLWGP